MLDYFAKTFQLGSPNSGTPCIKCRCNARDVPWTEFHPENAAWLAHEWAPRAWALAHPEKPVIFDLSGVDVHTIAPDWMHCKHLGCDQYAYGSILWLLTHRIGPAPTPEANMDIMWKQIVEEYKQHGIKGGYSEIRLSMFTPTAAATRARFPCLKGKAAEVKSLAKPLLSLWGRYMDHGSKQHRTVRILLTTSVKMEHMMETHKSYFRIPSDDAKIFKDTVYQYVAATSSLGSFYHPRSEWLFHFTIKCHYMLHIARSCHEINPRVGWCYQGEDMMNKTKTLVQSCARGTPTHTLISKLMKKYTIGLSYLVMDHSRWWR